MKILMVCGIFEPEVGGPATYAPQLARALQERGHDITVVTFSNMLSQPGDGERPYKIIRVVRGSKILNRFRFFFSVLSQMQGIECLYMLDWFAAGLPAALAARIKKVPYIVRVGGDYLWEQRYLESGQRPLPLHDFYEHKLHLQYGLIFRIIRKTLSNAAHVIFNSDAQRELYIDWYGLAREQVSTIFNPLPSSPTGDRSLGNKEFVFWGRFIVMKNLDTLVRAFAKAQLPAEYRLTLIGDGPRKEEIFDLIEELKLSNRVLVQRAMPRAEAFSRIRNCRAFVLPSWTDISPNQVYEALAIGLPALVTKENYLSIAAQLPLTIDPRSVDDVAEKLEILADDEKYKAFADTFHSISYSVSWDDVAEQHVTLFAQVIKK